MPAHIRVDNRPPSRQPSHISIPRRDNDSGSSKTGLIAFAVIIAISLCAAIVIYVVLRYLRIRDSAPKYIPGTWLKRKWRAWVPFSEKRKQATSLPSRSDIQRSRTPSNADTLNMIRQSYDGLSAAEGSNRPSTQGTANVDRHTSVRSIATLPAYSAEARPTEQTMGREGERGGVDTVLEFPETVDEEEERREEEMEALYQIRRTRREERAAREERRRLRREARARGDTETLAALREEARLGRSANASGTAMEVTSEALIHDHRSRERGRRVSSVSYMDLGVARHDGSRVRAGSNESDRRPLMDSAASMGGRDSSRPRSGSGPLQQQQQYHQRNLSTSSLSRFITPDISDDDRSSAEFEIISPPQGGSRATSASRPPLRLMHSSSDVGDSHDANERSPPQYDELSPIADRDEEQRQPQPYQQPALQPSPGGPAPDYESPTTSDAPRLPAFARLPSIRVTPFTPDVESSGASFSALR